MKLIHTTESKRFYLMPDRGVTTIMADWVSPTGEIIHTSFHSECRDKSSKQAQAIAFAKYLACTLRAEY